MTEWENEKKAFVEKLSSADKTFEEIFKIDSEGLVIQGVEREELHQHYEANKKILNKLQSREFTVAVVGLEKAGKSTLGDALIKSMVLPEYSERCTYTTTEIRSGDKDIAEIFFYSREEFNRNFKRMLGEVKYPDAVDFSAMTLETFKRYWQAVETDPEQRGLFMLHNGTTAEDIKAMLEGKQKIISLFGKPSKKYEKSDWGDSDEFTEFKSFITGMSGKNSDGSVIREPYPYAVKNVIIQSTELGEMDHLVLYDVPGFDSPTELHKRQTEEMLKESDAIILVTNAGDRPNLTGTQLDMLRKGQDRDGIKLSAKCFVFGNKIDRAVDYQTAKNNLAALTNEAVNKYQIALSNHIVGGSARAYLEKENLLSGDVASKTIADWDMVDGIKILQEKMQDYYDNDRFEVLKLRAEKTLSDTREILQNMLERYSGGELNNDDASIEIIQVIQSRLPQFVEKANEVTKIYTNKIIAESPFTNSLKDEIEKIYPLVNDENGHNKLIEKVELSLAIDPDGIYPTSAVNANIRDKLSKDFIENIVVSASKLTAERQKILRRELINSFLEIMGLEESTSYKTELENSVDKLFDEMLIEGGSECNFNSLVERFVTTLIQTLILNPFAAEERCDKVKATLAELVALSVYYSMPEKSAETETHFDDIGKDSVKFFAKILAHEGIETAAEIEVDATENENFLRKIYEENKEQICKGASFAVDFLPFGKWAKLLMKSGINLAEMKSDKTIKGRDKLDYKIEEIFYSSDWAKLSPEQRKENIESVIKKYQQENSTSQADDESLTAQLNNLHEKAKKTQRMKNKSDMIAILDTDIEILRDITAKSVLNAIGLERAFISVVTKNVELIREHLQDEKGGKAFRDWVRLNAFKLMPSKFESIIENKAINENRKAIVSAVRNVLNKWEI